MKAISLLFIAVLFGGAVFPAASAEGAPRVERAWARPTPPGAKVGGVYMRIHNGATPDRLVAAESAAATAVELHAHAVQAGVARMRAVSEIDLPAGAVVELKPGGLHLMLIGLSAPLVSGQTLPLTLRFAKAGERTVLVHVGEPGGGADAASGKGTAGHRH